MTKCIPLITLLFSFLSYAQVSGVGIGTTDPQQKLHIAGDSTTIRVDSYNSTNNPNNTGIRSQPVYTNADGDLFIPPSPSGTSLVVNEFDFINNASPYHLQTGVNGEPMQAEVYKTASFTLTQPALVMVCYSLSFSVEDWSGTSVVTDGKPKLTQSFFAIGDGTTPNLSTIYGRTGQTYTNDEDFLLIHYVAKGSLFNTANETILLGAGTYSIHVFGEVSSGDGFTFPKASDAFSVKMGTSNDYIKVLAVY